MSGVAVNRLHWPVDVLGPGRRVGIWLQGCSIGCPGCVSRDTWPALDAADHITPAELLARVDTLVAAGPPGPVEGVTISGGEPFDQAQALAEVLELLRHWLAERGTANADLLVYTGYDEPDARRIGPAVFSLADGVIAGPFRVAEPGTRWWGSGNQHLIARDERSAARYEAALTATAAEVQVSVEGGQVFIVGIPNRHTLATVESLVAKSGIRLSDVSWRP